MVVVSEDELPYKHILATHLTMNELVHLVVGAGTSRMSSCSVFMRSMS